jgi:hypothetical protein
MTRPQIVLVGSWNPGVDEVLVQTLEREGAEVVRVPLECALDAARTVVVLASLPPEAVWSALDPEAALDEPLEAAWIAARSAVAAIRAAGGGALTFAVPASRGDVARTTLAGGLALLARSLAVECGAGEAGIRVNAATVDPAQPGDGAKLVAFLCSDAASFVSGQVFATPTAE